VRLLDVNELPAGKSAWAQLSLEKPAVVARRDRFILRFPSPATTIGGGEIVDIAPRYHRRRQPAVLEALERLALDSPEELVLAMLDQHVIRGKSQNMRESAYELRDIAKRCNVAEDVTQRTLETLLVAGKVRKVGSYWFAQPLWNALVEQAVALVKDYHRSYPLRSGFSKEEWRTRLHLSSRMAAEIFQELQAEGQLVPVIESGQHASPTTGSLIRLPSFVPAFTQEQQRQVEQVLGAFRASPYTPPGRAEVEAMVGAEVMNALIEQGRIIKLGDGILFLRETYQEATARIIAFIREHGKITVAEARDMTGATRKYILPLLEHMDALHITRRAGDERVLAEKARDSAKNK
jgi:selenocysteine-specific elongation factor